MGYSTVINAGVLQGANNRKDTGKNLQYGGGQPEFTDSVGGTVRVVVEGKEYVWGPNDAKTLENGIAAACVAASNSRLRIMDSRDGIANASGKGVS